VQHERPGEQREAGQDAVLDRLLDLLLIDAVRTYLARADFKRVRGISPHQHRAAQRHPTPA
jgi:cupin